jgi:hypothetical protein
VVLTTRELSLILLDDCVSFALPLSLVVAAAFVGTAQEVVAK